MQEEPRDPASPFAALIQDYMWNKRRPPITANRLATELHISRQTVTNWLSGKKPQPEMLPRIAVHMGIALKDLYEAAGYPTPDDRDEDIVERFKRMTPREQQDILRRIDAFLGVVREQKTDRTSNPKMLAGAR